MGLLWFNHRENSIDRPAILYNELAADDVVKAGMWIYDLVTAGSVYAELSEQEVHQIRSWLNSLTADKIKEVDNVHPDNLNAEVIFSLKSNTEVRIWYNKKDIQVLTSDKKVQKMYVIGHPELKKFFDNKLKKHKAKAFENTVILKEAVRLRRVRIVRDYVMFDRREASQYYPDAKGANTLLKNK
ncbi:hypothetical protein D3C73_695420 [compost metagenome]